MTTDSVIDLTPTEQPVEVPVAERKLSELDSLKLQNEKQKFQNAQLSYQLFIARLYVQYSLSNDDSIDENGNIVSTLK